MLAMAQNEQSKVNVHATIPRTLRDDLRSLAEAHMHSQAAEIRRAIADHVKSAGRLQRSAP
jgi:hypothetical protein